MQAHTALEIQYEAEGKKQVEKQHWTDRDRLTLADTVSRLTFPSREIAGSKKSRFFFKMDNR